MERDQKTELSTEQRRAKIRSLTNELAAFSAEADRLHELLTKGIGNCWRGDAAQACLRESSDNRENAEQTISEFRTWCESVIEREEEYIRPIPDNPAGSGELPASGNTDALPEGFLL